MKKIIYLSVCAVALIGFAACNNSKNLKNAGNVTRDYAMNMQNGNYDNFVEKMMVSNASPAQAREMKEKFAWMLKEKIDPIIREKGGIRDIQVVSQTATNDGMKATVVLKTIYNNGQTENTTYDLLWAENRWNIDMNEHREVWKTKTADGRDVTFKLKDYDHKEVFKEKIDGEREVIKTKETDDKEVHKTIENGDREVEKIKDKKHETVVKEKENGERKVTKTEKD